MEPPTATIAICAADSWWWSPSSWNCGGAEDSVSMQQHSIGHLAALNVRSPDYAICKYRAFMSASLGL